MSQVKASPVGTWAGTVEHDDQLDPFEISFGADGSVALKTPTSIGGGAWAVGEGSSFSYFLREMFTDEARKGGYVRIQVAANVMAESYEGVGSADVVFNGRVVHTTRATFTGRRTDRSNPSWHTEHHQDAARQSLTQPEIDILRQHGFSGQVIAPEDETYDERRAGWNLSGDNRPRAILRPVTASDVASALAFADALKLPVALQATGHGPSSPMQDCLLIDTSSLTGCVLEGDVATVGAGTRWRDALPTIVASGQAALCGSSPDVGIAGFVSGGGLPVLCRSHGLAADSVLELEVATTSGELLTCSPQDHPELFWGSLGGHGNLGAITSVRLRLIDDPQLFGGILMFGEDKVDAALRTYFGWTPDLPDEMNSSIAVLRFPDLPQTPPEMRNRYFVQVRIAYTGDPAEGQRLIEPLRALGTEEDSVRVMPYTEIGTIYAEPPRPTPARIRTELTWDFPAEAVEALVRVAGADAKLPFGGVEFRHLGGVLARSTSPAPVSYRAAQYQLFITNPAFDDRLEEVVAAQDHIFEELGPWLSGHAWPGFLFTRDVTEKAVQRAYDDDDWARLQAAKQAYDPKNTLRVNHNIPPMGPANRNDDKESD
ncbi:MAG TPA: FAD-binding oxidoreductase [Jatrophihabitans sp.]|jgi:FAD/FMN-containing dehydrogenase|uniref:FAD-binding oxidoreductase n=1 Tax=Jatrophihabitans sp. TaxID=1932789 RepID=UPI002EEEB18F